MPWAKGVRTAGRARPQCRRCRRTVAHASRVHCLSRVCLSLNAFAPLSSLNAFLLAFPLRARRLRSKPILSRTSPSSSSSLSSTSSIPLSARSPSLSSSSFPTSPRPPPLSLSLFRTSSASLSSVDLLPHPHAPPPPPSVPSSARASISRRRRKRRRRRRRRSVLGLRAPCTAESSPAARARRRRRRRRREDAPPLDDATPTSLAFPPIFKMPHLGPRLAEGGGVFLPGFRPGLEMDAGGRKRDETGAGHGGEEGG